MQNFASAATKAMSAGASAKGGTGGAVVTHNSRAATAPALD